MDLSLSQDFFDLGTYFWKRRVLRASKRDLEQEISTTVDRDWIFFLPRFRSTKQAAEAFFLGLSLNKIRPAESSIHSIITVIHFSRAIKLYKRFYKIISGNNELRLTRLLRESSCHANRWTDKYAVIRALQSRNWNARFFYQKNWKASENVQKSEITRW